MRMSSFLISSNYVEPKFPPCQEFSHSDYSPSGQSFSSFQHGAPYPRSVSNNNNNNAPYSSCLRSVRHGARLPHSSTLLPGDKAHVKSHITPSPSCSLMSSEHKYPDSPEHDPVL
ncbi:uncharacterized protein LOC494794 [Xenopus laevis]|nr:uncharacterized protein LOC494794 [Xenopus laevis]AAH82916.1 LOC494794 protein [Xenopus laevis]